MSIKNEELAKTRVSTRKKFEIEAELKIE